MISRKEAYCFARLVEWLCFILYIYD